MGLMDIIFGAIEHLTTGTRIPDSAPMNLGPLGVYEGSPSKCSRCGSANISVSGGWEEGNVRTETVYCNECEYKDSYAIA